MVPHVIRNCEYGEILSTYTIFLFDSPSYHILEHTKKNACVINGVDIDGGLLNIFGRVAIKLWKVFQLKKLGGFGDVHLKNQDCS